MNKPALHKFSDSGETWLIFDMLYLCYRNFYAMRGRRDVPASFYIYSAMCDVIATMKRFDTTNAIFCFDGGYSKRTAIYPEYKLNRSAKKKTKQEKHEKKLFLKEIKKLRTVYLPKIGATNICFCEGYESDDLIAKLVTWTIPQNHECIIVSGDSDLYQLVRRNVITFNPYTKENKVMDYKRFQREYNIRPFEWAHVLSYAGCHTDNVVGISGVGEKTAIKIIRCNPDAIKKWSPILDRKINKEIVSRNLKLVGLPFIDTPGQNVYEQRLSNKRWIRFVEKMGLEKSMAPRI